MSRRRFQMPSVRRRERCKRPYWYVQYRTDILVDKGQIERRRKDKFLGYCPTTNEPTERKRRGEITKREAERLRNRFMEKINSATQVIQSQIPVSEFVAIWLDKHVSTLGAGTQAKYRTHVRNHVLPDFEELRLCDIDAELLQEWINRKALGWWAKLDLRNLMSCVFSKAIDWGYWEERNPAERVSAGKKRAKRERRLLGDEDTELLLAELPEFLQLIIAFLRMTGCRISEALGVQWKHVDLLHGWVRIQQRWYRGDLDVVKSERGDRELPLGRVVGQLAKLRTTADEDAFIFDRGDGQPWDDRKLMKDWIRPKARLLGIYFEGLGFHSFRREVATALQEAGASSIETQLYLGHSKAAMTGHYTLLQRERMKKLAENMQERRSSTGQLLVFPKEKKA